MLILFVFSILITQLFIEQLKLPGSSTRPRQSLYPGIWVICISCIKCQKSIILDLDGWWLHKNKNLRVRNYILFNVYREKIRAVWLLVGTGFGFSWEGWNSDSVLLQNRIRGLFRGADQDLVFLSRDIFIIRIKPRYGQSQPGSGA